MWRKWITFVSLIFGINWKKFGITKKIFGILSKKFGNIEKNVGNIKEQLYEVSEINDILLGIIKFFWPSSLHPIKNEMKHHYSESFGKSSGLLKQTQQRKCHENEGNRKSPCNTFIRLQGRLLHCTDDSLSFVVLKMLVSSMFHLL